MKIFKYVIARYLAVVWLALALISQLHAETSITAGGLGWHVGESNDDYNNWHRLVSAEQDRVMAAYFKNSYDRDTVAALYRLGVFQYGGVEMDVLVGGMRGYTSCPLFRGGNEGGKSKICPMAAPTLRFNADGDFQPTLILAGNSLSLSLRMVLNN